MGSDGQYQGTGVSPGEGMGDSEPVGRIILHSNTARSGEGHLSIAWDTHNMVVLSYFK